MSKTCIISLGANQGNRIKNLSKARKILEVVLGKIKIMSSVYESSSWGYSDPVNYFNQVILIDTEVEPLEILHKCLATEKALGRTRTTSNYEARPIDIDILFYNDLKHHSTELIIPHPKLHLRRFVLEPLHQVRPDFVHPVFKKTVSELLMQCKDTGWVKLIKNNE